MKINGALHFIRMSMLPRIQVFFLKNPTNLIQTLPFKSKPSNTKINYHPVTAGPTAERRLAQTPQIVNTNTSVSNGAKGIPLIHAEDCSKTMLPIPIKVDKLECYDTHLRQKLVQGFTFGFKIISTICRENRKVSKNNRSSRENTQAVTEQIQKEILKGRIGWVSLARLLFQTSTSGNHFVLFCFWVQPQEVST